MQEIVGNVDIALAQKASAEFAKFTKDQVQAIVQAVARRAAELAKPLASETVRESRMGNAEDKVTKNLAFSEGFLREYGDLDLVTHRYNADEQILEIAKPMGVILAITPTTNPIATVYHKTLSALLTRNAIIISPHPRAKKVCTKAVKELVAAGRAAGLPEGTIQILEEPDLKDLDVLMKHDTVALILATGGGAMVKAAYQSGTPAIGVGPGNAPALVDDTADVTNAAEALISSKTFDNSVLCTAESAVVVTQLAASKLLNELKRRGAWICDEQAKTKLSELMYPRGNLNPDVVGQTALELAQAAGIQVPRDTKVLLVPIEQMKESETFTHEKLSPVLGWKVSRDFNAAVRDARALLEVTGKGHSAVIHSTSQQNIIDYDYQMPVHRISINSPGSQGNAGIGTHLPPSMSIGTGVVGGSSSDTNFTPEQLVQWCRVTYPDAVEPSATESLSQLNFQNQTSSTQAPTVSSELGSNATEEIDVEDLRLMILEELREMIGGGVRG